MSGYTLTIDGKRYDRALYEAGQAAAANDGCITEDEVDALLEKALDHPPGRADLLTTTEQRTLQLLRETMAWSPRAEEYLREALCRATGLCPQPVEPTTPPGGTVSANFPRESRFDNPLAQAAIPPETCRGDIEADAHFLNYTTADGQHYAELWWMGGDGGTPFLAYLVDAEGVHFLPELSQPLTEGARPFSSLQEAKERFIRLAEQFYAE